MKHSNCTSDSQKWCNNLVSHLWFNPPNRREIWLVHVGLNYFSRGGNMVDNRRGKIWLNWGGNMMGKCGWGPQRPPVPWRQNSYLRQHNLLAYGWRITVVFWTHKKYRSQDLSNDYSDVVKYNSDKLKIKYVQFPWHYKYSVENMRISFTKAEKHFMCHNILINKLKPGVFDKNVFKNLTK